MLVYLDWNIFSNIRNIGSSHMSSEDNLLFMKLHLMILKKTIRVPYSNAHINDLLRGHAKNQNYTEGDLEIIKRLTNNLCLTQYWKESDARWHYRDPNEFFFTALDDINSMPDKSYTELLSTEGLPDMTFYYEMMRKAALPSGFSALYKQDPIFSKIYPRSKVSPNMLSLCEDIYELTKAMKKDYRIYKELKIYIAKMKAKMGKQAAVINKLVKEDQTPKQLTWNDVWESTVADAQNKNKISENPVYQKITDTYVRINFQGHKSDEVFTNMIDDSMHVFYGAHCNYFVTLDDRCHYKAVETYKKLGITTQALKPKDFLDEMKAKGMIF